jgi:hypothetical protein
MIWSVCIFLLVVASTLLVNQDSVEQQGLSFKSLCHLNSNEQVCWIDKAKDKGKTLSEINNYFCTSEEDFTKIVSKLKEESIK